MEIQHFSHKHPLVFIEGVGENEVIVCTGCDEPISDAAYKCSHECSFFLHKSCTELQREIQHPVHPKHPLVLIASESRVCDGCCKSPSKSCFFYHCKECRFDLDIKCASNWQSSTAEDGHQHAFVPILNRIQFTCNICGEDRQGCARVCSICQLLVDIYCAELARTIQIGAHKDHFLTLIFCLDNQVKEQDDQVLCQLCYKTVNTKYGAYYCKKCGFVVHLNCAEKNVLQQFDNLDSSVNLQYLSMDSVDLTTNVTKEINPEEGEGAWDILGDEHPFVGKHKFILSTDKKLEDDKFCEVCMQLISGSIFYTCATCGGKCNMFIHDTCGNLPRKKQHFLHKHPLTLSFNGGTFYCKACMHYRHGFRYSCDIGCNCDLDIHCSSIPDTIELDGHQHSLRLAIRPYEECNGCHIPKYSNGAFVCIKPECNFALGFECAILPVVVKYDEYDRHLLKLTYSVEDDSGEYYCFICEKERNPKQWFYYCGECDFGAHPHCILGKYPYIKYGSSFVNNLHQHPLTFVRKTQFSPPCDSCHKPYEGMGIECKQCEFTVHNWGCLWRIGKKE